MKCLRYGSLSLLLPSALLSSPVAAQFDRDTAARKLSADYALAPAGDVVAAELSPDRTRVVFLARPRARGDLQLFVAPADGSAAPVALSPARLPDKLEAGGDPRAVFEVTPDSGQVVFAMYASGPGSLFTERSLTLYRAPLDGSSAPAAIQPPPALGGNVESFSLAPYSLTAGVVVYLADQDLDEAFQLFGAPLDGSAAPVRLHAPLAANRDVKSFALAADGTSVAFVADPSAFQRGELFVAPTDGSAPELKLSAALHPNSFVRPPVLTPDGSRAVYVEDAEVDSRDELYSVALDGSTAPVKLNAALAGSTDVRSFELTPDGSGVVFSVTTNPGRTLFVAPVNGSGAAVTIGNPEADVFVAGATRAVYRSFAGDLWSAPYSGAAALPLSTLLEVRQFQLDPSGTRVVFTAIPSGPTGPVRLYGVPADGSAGALELQGLLPANGNVLEPPTLTADGASVLYLADAEVDGRFDLFEVPSAGGVPATRLALGSAEMRTQLVVVNGGADDAALFQGDLARPGVVELQRVPLDASSGPSNVSHLPLDTMLGDFTELALSPDERWVVYRGDPNEIGRFELFAVRADGSGHERRVSGAMPADGDVLADFRIDPRSRYAVYRADAEEDEVFALYRVALDGSEAPLRLSVPLAPGGDVQSFALSPEGTFVAYLADADPDGQLRLYSTRNDGAFPIVLTPSLVASGNVEPDFRWADDFHVVYRADQDIDGTLELYLADGMGHTPKLSSPLVAGGDVTAFAVANGGVAYLADQDVDEQFELYARNGPAAAVQVSAEPVLASGDVLPDFRLTPGGEWVLYRADPTVDGSFELVRAPLAGGAGLRLDTSTGVLGLELTADGERVVYRATTAQGIRLHSRRVDASTAQVVLVAGNVPDFVLSPTSDRVAYRAGGFLDVFLRAIDGSGVAVQLPSFNPFLGHTEHYAFSPDGKNLILQADDTRGLLRASVQDPLDVERLVTESLAPTPAFVPASRQVLFLGQHQSPGSFELYGCSYTKPVSGRRDPR